MIDLVAKPLKLWSMKYLVLIRKEFLNYIEGRTLTTKIIEEVYRSILEDIFIRYGSIWRMKINWGELDITKTKDFFQRYDVKLKLTTSYNLEANGKSKKSHLLIISVILKAYKDKPRQ